MYCIHQFILEIFCQYIGSKTSYYKEKNGKEKKSKTNIMAKIGDKRYKQKNTRIKKSKFHQRAMHNHQ